MSVAIKLINKGIPILVPTYRIAGKFGEWHCELIIITM